MHSIAMVAKYEYSISLNWKFMDKTLLFKWLNNTIEGCHIHRLALYIELSELNKRNIFLRGKSLEYFTPVMSWNHARMVCKFLHLQI